MQKILLAQAQPDMVLARDVITPKGQVLCGKGTTLTEALIDRLRRMEIAAVTVEGHPVGDPRDPAAERAAIERRFSRVAGDPVLDHLKALLLAEVDEADAPTTGGGGQP